MCLAPGDPVTVTEITAQGASRKQGAGANPSENRYLQFREFYGLTLPIFLNTWPYIDKQEVLNIVKTLSYPTKMSLKDQDDLRIQFGDQSRFIMPELLAIIENVSLPLKERETAQHYFIRGAFRLGYSGSGLTDEQRKMNRKISEDSEVLSSLPFSPQKLEEWYEANKAFYSFEPTFGEKLKLLFFETRFSKYLSRVLTLDFGTMRNDPNKTVISEVTKRFKYSLTLSIIPLIITVFLSLIFGMIMAVWKGRIVDGSLNFVFLLLFAIPIFVAVPFLIENFAIGKYFPFTSIPVPTNGFTSPDNVYEKLTSWQKLLNILQHIALPLVAILYGSLAVQSRLSRTAFLETMKKDYVRTAVVKGVPKSSILFRHIGRNASITLVTSVAGSLGVVLGGSLIVETLFEIDGFGKFFYDAILNRDYNVIMFSALAGSFLTLLGYLIGDIAYMLLDPRVRLD